jgi:hypothetical protein
VRVPVPFLPQIPVQSVSIHATRMTTRFIEKVLKRECGTPGALGIFAIDAFLAAPHSQSSFVVLPIIPIFHHSINHFMRAIRLFLL